VWTRHPRLHPRKHKRTTPSVIHPSPTWLLTEQSSTSPWKHLPPASRMTPPKPGVEEQMSHQVIRIQASKGFSSLGLGGNLGVLLSALVQIFSTHSSTAPVLKWFKQHHADLMATRWPITPPFSTTSEVLPGGTRSGTWSLREDGPGIFRSAEARGSVELPNSAC